LNDKKPSWIIFWGGSLVVTLLWHSKLIVYALSNWKSDSFYTLNVVQQSGLVLLSVLLIGLVFWLSDIKTRYIQKRLLTRRLLLAPLCLADILFSLATFILFLSLSLQVYYLYYQLIFPGLPSQWVVDFEFNLNLLSMSSPTNFNELLSGLTAWVMVFAILLRYLVKWSTVKSVN